MIKEIAGYIFVIWGILDAYKYELQALKILKVKSAKEHSRMFLNMAIGNDIYRFVYFFFVNKDWYVLATALLAIVFMLHYWFMIYLHYPYRRRNYYNFKRPNAFIYFINSLLPNRVRKHL
jgi:hypothetical protein